MWARGCAVGARRWGSARVASGGIGLTFSQVQKYEKGTNRIGAGRLYQIAGFLGVPPSHFFAGIDGTPEGDATGVRNDEMQMLNEAFIAIQDRETRASVLALVRSLANDNRRIA